MTEHSEMARNADCELSGGVQAEMKKRRLALISEQRKSQHGRRFGQWSEKNDGIGEAHM